MLCNLEVFNAQFIALQASEIIKKKQEKSYPSVLQIESFLDSVAELNRLLQIYYIQENEDRRLAIQAIEGIGKELNSLGGFDLMLLVCQCLTTHEDDTASLNWLWNGIGKWEA